MAKKTLFAQIHKPEHVFYLGANCGFLAVLIPLSVGQGFAAIAFLAYLVFQPILMREFGI